MKNPYKDLKGKRFGRLVAVEIVAVKYQRTKWLCRCDCGVEKIIPIDSLSSGRANSCGCYRKEVTSKRFKKHGLRDKKLYENWINMRSRCSNPKSDSFKNYGKRGITVCKEWDDFENFYQWSVDNGYGATLTIDRINNDGNYEPGNCRWADKETQANNMTTNVRVEIEGVTRTISEHSKHYGLDYSCFYYRYVQGFTDREMVKPANKKIMVELDGETKNLKEWSRYYDFAYSTIQHRYSKGIRGKDLFAPVNEIQSQKAKKRKWESA